MSLASASTPRVDAPGPLGWRVGFATTLSLAMATGTFPSYAFGVLAPHLVAEYGLSRAQLGGLTTLFFLVGGGLSLVAGPLVDRVGGRRVMLGSFAVIVCAVLGMAMAPSYPAMLALAAGGGLALATGNPVTNKLVAVHVAAGRRGITMGVKQAGVQVGAFLAGALLAPAAVRWGWRQALAASVVVPLAGLLATLRVVPVDAGGVGVGGRGTPVAPAVWWLAAYAFLMGAGVAAVTAYLPLYAVERLSLSARAAGAVAAAIGLVGIISRVAWAWASERLRTFTLPLQMMGLGAVLAVGLIVAAQQAGAWLVWVAGALFGATAVTWNAVGMLAVLDQVDSQDAGRASGYVLFGFYGGFVGSPIAFGALVDATGSYTLAWTGIGALFMAATLVVTAWRRRAVPAEAGRHDDEGA